MTVPVAHHPKLTSADDLGVYLAQLGERVRTMRARRGMSRKALATHSGVSERYLAQLEGGTGNCSIVLLRRIAGALGLPVAELIDDRPERPADSLLLAQLIERLSPVQIAEARDYLTARFGGGVRPDRRQRIALIGLRGAGKSTLGALLARHLRAPFIELDREIERQSGMQLAAVFELFGQPTFRRLERDALQSVLQSHDRFVLATGGSLVTEPATYELLMTSCLTVWVRARPDDHMSRVIAQGDLRPMSNNAHAMDDLVAILNSREPLYAKADLTLHTAGSSAEESFKALVEMMNGTARERSSIL